MTPIIHPFISVHKARPSHHSAKMKLSTPLAAVLGFSAYTTNAFTTAPQLQSASRASVSSITLLRAAELKPEPEDGEELKKISSSLPDSRMKNLGPADEEGVYNFWLTATADGEKVKKLRVQTEKEASRNANFPGFRKASCMNWWSGNHLSFTNMPCSFSLSIHNSLSLGTNSTICSTSDD